MPKTKVLMSVDNPTGVTLEAILQDLIRDIEIKSEETSVKLVGMSSTHERYEVMCKILENNQKIAMNLRAALGAQISNMNALDALGKNQGPLGTPRI